MSVSIQVKLASNKLSSLRLLSILVAFSFFACTSARPLVVNLSNPVIKVGLACTVRSYPAPTTSLAPTLYDPNKLVTVYNDYRNYSTSSWNEALNAAILALNEINLGWYPFPNLRNFTLQLRYEDTKTDDKTAAKAALNLGDAAISQCPELNAVAQMFANNFEARGMTSVLVRDRTALLYDPVSYPNTIATKLSVTTFGTAMASAFNHIGWRSVVVVSTNEQLSVDFLLQFLPTAASRGVSVSSVITVLNPYSPTDCATSLAMLRQTQTRVVLLSSSITTGNPIMKQAAAMGLLGPGSGYTWVHYGNCLEIPSNPYANRTYIDGFLCLTTVEPETQAKRAMMDRLSVGLPAPPFSWMYNTFRWEKAADVYDGFLLMASALNDLIGRKTQCIRDGWSSNPLCIEMAADANEDLTIRKIIYNSTLAGLSRNISFRNGVSLTNILVKQMRWDPTVNRESSFTVISIDPQTFATTSEGTFRWSDGSSVTPPDTQPPTVLVSSFSPSSAYGAMALAGIVIVFGIFCLCFSVAYSDLPIIRLSAPRMNMISVLGCIAFCVCVFLLSVDPPTVHVCSALIWLVPISFTLLFTPMFSKSFRIYRIFSKRLEKTVITDWQLARIVVAFLAIDIALILAFTLPDSVIVSQTLLLEVVEPALTTQYTRLSCNSTTSSVIVYLMLAYKGLILLGASYMTFKTRQAHMEQVLADSRSIGMSVYSTTLLAGFLVPIQVGIYGSVEGQKTGFVLTAYGLVLLSLLNLIFLFVPKMLIIWVDKDTRKSFASTCLAQCFRAVGVPMTSKSSDSALGRKSQDNSALGNKSSLGAPNIASNTDKKPDSSAQLKPQTRPTAVQSSLPRRGSHSLSHSLSGPTSQYTGRTSKFGPSQQPPESPRLGRDRPSSGSGSPRAPSPGPRILVNPSSGPSAPPVPLLLLGETRTDIGSQARAEIEGAEQNRGLPNNSGLVPDAIQVTVDRSDSPSFARPAASHSS